MQTTLSEYQKQLLKLIAEGHNVTAIAKKQKANLYTTRSHVWQAMHKLGAKTTAHAIAIAIRKELI